MKNYEYEAVSCKPESGGNVIEEDDSSKPFWRQVMIGSSFSTILLSIGLCMGAPTVFIPQLKKDANSTEYTTEMGTWLSSVHGFAAMPWVVVLALIMLYYGRKATFALTSLCTIVVFISYLMSTTTTHIMIAELLFGLPHAAGMIVVLAIATEYISPKYRGVFLTFKSATFHWGVWISNAIGTYFYWKYIMVLGLVLSMWTLNVFFWPKSPYWLAFKGRYEECRVAYRWLVGENEITEKHLEKLIEYQMEHRNKNNRRRSFKTVISFLWKKEFYKPVLLGCLLRTMYLFSGKMVCTMYALDIIEQLTNCESAAYTGMLLLDGVYVLSMYVGCIMTRYIKRRTMMIGFGSVAVFFLLALSLYCYLIKLSILTEDKYIVFSLLVGFFLCIGLGPLILMSCMLAEMLPLNYKSEALTIICLLFCVTQSTILKLSPYVFKHWGPHFAFLFFGCAVTICLVIFYKYLPETKDKTTHEIEEYFRNS